MYHWYTGTLLHWILLHGYFVHCYSCSYNTVTRFTCIHTLIVSVFLLHGSLFLLHDYIMYSCYMTIFCYWNRYDTLVIEHECCWYAMCGNKCCVELSHGTTSRIPHLLFPASRYLVSWYQQTSCPIIILHEPCTVLFLDTLCNLNIINIT